MFDSAAVLVLASASVAVTNNNIRPTHCNVDEVAERLAGGAQELADPGSIQFAALDIRHSYLL